MKRHRPGRPRRNAVLLAALLAGVASTAGAQSAEAPAATAPADVAVAEARPAPAVEAARVRDAAALSALLARDARGAASQRSADGTTALHWAAYHDDVELATRLIAAGADVNARNDYEATPLGEAAVVGNVEMIRRLLAAGADAEAANSDGQTPLMVIARTSNVPAAELLLKRGAKVDTREKWRGQTALMWAAAERQPAMVKLLLARGADPEARSNVNQWERQVTAEPRMQARPSGGFTPLLYAARSGCADCVRLLLKAGADVNGTDPDGVTPLILAILNLSFDAATVLLDAGAEINRWDTWGRSALYAAVDMNTLPTGGRADRPSLDETTSLQLIERMLEAGANPNLQLKLFPPYRSLRDDRGADGLLTVGTTPLIRAAKAADLPTMRLLLRHGARVDLATVNGITPLLAAAGNASIALDTRGRYRTQEQALEAVDMLLEAGAELEARDRNGQTALHGAASWGWNDMVRKLASRGVDLQAKDAQGRTAADVARGLSTGSGRAGNQSHPETEALLRRLMSGAEPVAPAPARTASTGG